jgi:PAS domain S-box-containing protein
MVTVVDVLGIALVGSIVPSGVMVYAAWRNQNKPASVWFAVLAIAIAGWSSTYGLSLLFDDRTLTIVAANVEFFFTDTVTIGWFLLALEYVRRERVSNYWMALFVFPLVSQVVVWTNPEHGLVRTSARVDVLGILHPTFGPWFFVQATFSYALVVAGLALFVRDYRTSQGIRRDQTGVLMAGAFVPFVANILYVVGLTPYPQLDITPLAFLFTSTVFTYGLYRYRLLELIPIARKTVMEEMEDAVITLDEDDRVADINPKAARILGIDPASAVGTHGEAVLADFPEMVDRFRDVMDAETEISITRDGEQRFFHLDISPIGGSETDVVEGRVIVLRDITERKEREQELDLLKQVLSRVLRHNIRNDVTVVTGYAEELADQTSGQQSALAETIVEKGDDIAKRSQKAVAVERVLSTDTQQVEVDLVEILDECVNRVRRTVGEYDLVMDTPPTCPVRAHETLEVALTNVIENGVVHNDADRPQVSVTVDCGDPVEVVVEDDGRGIPEDEIEVFESGEETKLRHSSGVGLWLALLIIRRSGGTIEFENTGQGTRVTITLEPA